MRARTSDSPDRPAPAAERDAAAAGIGGAREDGGAVGREAPDARRTLRQLATELRDVVLDVAWRQWRAIGGGAVVRSTSRATSGPQRRTRREPHALVDPEALVLLSLILVRDEQRLGDLLRDWVARNSELLSVQRIRNLAADHPDPLGDTLARRLAWLATVARDEGKDLRWRPLASGWTDAEGGFPGARGERGSSSGAGEALGRMHGAHAPAGAPTKARATRARLTGDATLLLRLRLGFGVGVKADLLAFLLARAEERSTVRDIADAVGYTVAAVRRAADDLAAARFIEALGRQPASYRATHGAWAPLLGLGSHPPRWASWRERFAFAAAFLHWADAAQAHPLSAYAFGAHGRQLLERHRPAFERDHVAVWSEHSPIDDWGAFVERSVRDLAAWMGEMA